MNTSYAVQALIDKITSLPAERIAEVEDFVDFLRDRVRHRRSTVTDNKLLDFPVDNLGKWPEDLSLRREDMYDDDGR